ncbi:MAG: hypothetical protein WC791_01865 [Candidatus Paceibacterota bacterium]|jgi:hypothetical protein
MSKIKELDLRLAAAISDYNAECAEIHNEKVLLIRKAVIKCSYCEKGSRLGKWDFIQKYWRPLPSVVVYTYKQYPDLNCQIVCPLCNARNTIFSHRQQKQLSRLLGHPEIKREEIFNTVWEQFGDEKLKKVFRLLELN